LDVINGFSGVLVSGASYGDGKVGGAFQFDGTNDQVWLGAQTNYDIATSAAGFTVEFWMKPQAAQASTVLGWTNGVRVERITSTSTGDGLRWYVTRTGSTFIDVLRVWSGSGWGWTHVALAYERASGVGRFYTNGL